jgi:predicted ester cyclase
MEVFLRDLNVADEILTHNFLMHAPCLPPDIPRGPQGAKLYASMLRSAFPDVQITHDFEVERDDRVVIRWTAKATHTGEFFGVAPTGKAITVTGIDVFRVEGGKLAELWQEWDQLGMMRQLGVIPAAGQAAA